MPRIRVKHRYFNIPMSRKFKVFYGTGKIPFPERLMDNNLKAFRIYPRFNTRYFDVEFITEEESQLIIKYDNILAIDLSLNNLATCVSNNGSSFIQDSRKFK